MKLVVVLVPAIALLRPQAAHAEDVAPAVRAMLANPADLAAWLAGHDPLIESARAKTEAASELSEQARVLPNPQLQAGVGGIGLGDPNKYPPMMAVGPTSFSQTANFSVGVGELVEIGKRGPRKAAAQLRAQEAGQVAIGALGARLGDATATLGKLAYVASRRDVVAQNLEAARQLQALEKIRLDNKDLSALEFGRIELDTEELELQLGRAEAELSSAVAACSATLYVPCSPAGLDAAALDAGAPLPDALPEPQKAIEDRPARQATKLEAQALGNDALLAHNRRIPDPTLGVSYTYDRYAYGGGLPQTIAVTVGFPIALFDTGTHDEAAARANARAIVAEDQATLREARGVVDALVAQRQTLVQTLQKLETVEIPKSTQIIAQTRKAFDLGQARLADLLLVERAHRDLLLEVLDTRFDLFNVRAQLRQALGLDDEIARIAGRRAR
ncbi:MAG: TolC family protein [Deltaproteobacteria bacterium]|nr:TolC family protein [Deltaproteobacteria bacterium]